VSKHLLALILSVWATAAAAQPSVDDIAALYRPLARFVDAAGKGDEKAMTALVSPSVTIIDDTPPYYFSGGAAVHDWLAAFIADLQRHGQSDPAMTLGSPTYAIIDGSAGYLVAPGHYTFKQGGVVLHEDGNFAAALTRVGDEWRIVSWTWAGSEPTP